MSCCWLLLLKRQPSFLRFCSPLLVILCTSPFIASSLLPLLEKKGEAREQRGKERDRRATRAIIIQHVSARVLPPSLPSSLRSFIWLSDVLRHRKKCTSFFGCCWCFLVLVLGHAPPSLPPFPLFFILPSSSSYCWAGDLRKGEGGEKGWVDNSEMTGNE